MIRFTLPWPHKDLSPNGRKHWAVKAKMTKAARADAYYTAHLRAWRFPSVRGRYKVHMAFAPPDKRRRDIDNLIASAKAHRDGIADALGIDDSRFVLSCELLDEVVKGGEVRVTVEAA